MQTGFHHVFGNFEHGGGFFGRKSFNVAQKEDSAIELRQGFDGVVQNAAQFRLAGQGFGNRGPIRNFETAAVAVLERTKVIERKFLRGAGCEDAFSMTAETSIAGDLPNPRLQAGRVAQLLQIFENLHERFLRDFFGIVAMAAHCIRVAEQFAVIEVDKLIESTWAAVYEVVGQLEFG